MPEPRSEEAPRATNEPRHSGASGLLEKVLERPNLLAALRRVRKNKGSPGVDGMTVGELPGHLKGTWSELREQLLAGTYQPSPVRRHAIPKRGGGTRWLGIPTVLDRFLQQALLQVLQPRFDPSFSDHSHGFRPGRSAHGAIQKAQRYVQEGRRWVVDVDLASFFDRVNHDVLMGKLARRIADKRVLRLIRHYLEAGVLANGVVIETYEGTPQGGPLSPLLANVLLDEVDRELERRGHAFVRYADDCNVYVRSKRAGERVMIALRQHYERLRLQINEAKSAVAPAVERSFLGFSLYESSKGEIQRRVSPKALAAMRDRVRQLTRRNIGRSLAQVCQKLGEYLRGWWQYFSFADSHWVLRDQDQWIRHRLRALQLKHWRRGEVIYRELRARGLSEASSQKVAANSRRWWHNSAMRLHVALPNSLFEKLGVPRLFA